MGWAGQGCEGRGPGVGRTARLASAALPCLVAVARRSAWATTMVRLEARARAPEARRRGAVRGATPTMLAVIMPTRAALSEIGRRDGSRGRGRRDGARATPRVDPTDVFEDVTTGRARWSCRVRGSSVRGRGRVWTTWPLGRTFAPFTVATGPSSARCTRCATCNPHPVCDLNTGKQTRNSLRCDD